MYLGLEYWCSYRSMWQSGVTKAPDGLPENQKVVPQIAEKEELKKEMP